ncbi:MAG: aromatic amino acid ammonia-lyase [Planctomycetota bacterium]
MPRTVDSTTAPAAAIDVTPSLGPDRRLDCALLEHLALQRTCPVGFSDEAVNAMESARVSLQRAVDRGDEIYGVTTGFGPLVSFEASSESCIQASGLLNHLTAGWGPLAPREVVRASMLIRAQSVAQGTSGITASAAEAWLDLLCRGVTPCIPEIGSVGASGDLIPLAHAARVLRGEGRAETEGMTLNAAEALEAAGLAPIDLAARDALSLVNGTSFMAGYLAIAIARAERLMGWSERITGWLYRLLGARPQAIDARLHAARGHDAQQLSATQIRSEATRLGDDWLDDSRPLQEVYSIRCAPQILGACRANIEHARRLTEAEINGVSDNPVVTPEAVLHGGNFQGQQIAFAADALNAALVQIGVLMERQLDVLLNPDLNNGAPLLLAWQPGRDAGMAGAQITASALVAEMRHHGGPAATSSIPTNGRNQDIVSMGTLAARAAYGQTDRLSAIGAILSLGAWRLDDLRSKDRAEGRTAEPPIGLFDDAPESFTHDRPLHADIDRLSQRLLRAA